MNVRVKVSHVRWAALIALLPLTGCKPPAADNYVERVGISKRQAPLPPIASPDSKGAIWVQSAKQADRLLYGKPGSPPLMALECNGKGTSAAIVYTRFARADSDAKAILALIGNGHVSRLKINATRDGDAWLWRGSIEPHDADLEVLTGAHAVEATVPGAGSVTLNPSPLPGALIRLCRERSPEPESPAATE